MKVLETKNVNSSDIFINNNIYENEPLNTVLIVNEKDNSITIDNAPNLA